MRRCSGPRIDKYFLASDLANTNFLILTGSDLVNSDDHPNDDESHGTHVTGTIAQSTGNNLGVAGVAFNTTIMPVKVLDANGIGFSDVIADAIHFATDNGADVINMSLGTTTDVQVMRDAVEYAFNNGVTVIASAGNAFQDGNPTNYPAAYDAHVIAVGATRYDEERAYYSSTGSYVDVAAPGGDVTVNQNEDTGCGNGCGDGVLQQTFLTNSPSDFGYFFYQGTSMAAPHVSGVAALLLAQDPTRTPDQIRNILQSTAEDKGAVGRDDEFGFGIIDAQAALSSLVPVVSISLTTDGLVEFGILPLGSTEDTTPSGINDVQTISIDTGPADLDIKSTVFSDNGNTWSLGSTNGANQVKWEFSADASAWNTFLTPNTLTDLANNVAQGVTQNLYLRITMPTDTASANQYSSTVTIVATAP
ncbi:S8 family serine peptidase [Patescibacteria group bacterium]|nr:S8 family serine peptidase [Patescibacteria group bacterium]